MSVELWSLHRWHNHVGMVLLLLPVARLSASSSASVVASASAWKVDFGILGRLEGMCSLKSLAWNVSSCCL